MNKAERSDLMLISKRAVRQRQSIENMIKDTKRIRNKSIFLTNEEIHYLNKIQEEYERMLPHMTIIEEAWDNLFIKQKTAVV